MNSAGELLRIPSLPCDHCGSVTPLNDRRFLGGHNGKNNRNSTITEKAHCDQ